MAVSDKAVSTEDLCFAQTSSTCVEVAKLEGVLNTLLENKVEAIKNDRSSSLHSSPKMLINRLRITSTSTSSSKDKYSAHPMNDKRRLHRRKYSDEIGLARPHKTKKNGKSRQRISSSSPESPRRYTISRCDKTPQQSDEEANQTFLSFERQCSFDKCISSGHPVHHCCCAHDNNGDIQLHFDEDYISLKIDDCDDYDEDGMMTTEALKRARRKRRKRRKRRVKRHLALAAVPVEPQHVKVLEADELPQRARWTIVATACLLLFMCLLLVGVTLRMAPIIDDMVRRENEELINSLNREQHITVNTSTLQKES